MTPDAERVALAWARQYLAGHHCTRCSREWITGASTRVLVHECRPPGPTYPRRVSLPPVEDTFDDARSRLWSGFADALPGEALLRKVDEE